MDYSIAFILPSATACETIKRVLHRMNYEYPVYAKSRNDAVIIARELLPHGLRMVVSHGITLSCLNEKLPIPTMEMPFSGLDTLIAVRTALGLPGKKIVHVGTKHLYYHIQKSLRILGEKEDLISFCELTQEISQEEVTQNLIDEGYDIFIAGITVVNYVRLKGKTGLEFDLDELGVEATIVNAQTVVNNMLRLEERNEYDKAILHATSDAIIALDSSRRITQVNPAALDIIPAPVHALTGRSIAEVLSKYRLTDIESGQPQGLSNSTPILIQELPVMVRGHQQGSVISMKRVSDIFDLEYQVKKDLLLKGLVAKYTFDDIQGISQAIRDIKQQAAVYAGYDSPVLIYGETGTGKELFAQSIHNASKRKTQPFVPINCATLSESLIESELFGYTQGAFTGANKNGKKGLFELADKGTIFLDEISEIPILIQSKLLRAIQEGEIMRVGGDKVIHVDTRVICSSNKDLLQLIQEKRFKDDLYYRLCVLEIDIPPLRERSDDIKFLAFSLMRSYARKYGKIIDSIEPEVLEFLVNLQFPGNVRELRSIIERMVILCDQPTLDAATLKKCHIRITNQSSPACPEDSLSVKNAEQRLISEALKKSNGNKAAAAKMLGIDPSTLYRKIKAYGVL
ncbi:sigma 54-interacting transcriptional regulator [Bacilliculturomica massiliensis]|uniref:sigma 54-interacting transcriptional regulator n=1 Tax=Bacilliculturomica massiliensis TaxID=1917867 RepID=UPI00103217E6|nr:sigma 54-interacting transcriptional regulator [Bacilliculturomica massiliensis]